MKTLLLIAYADGGPLWDCCRPLTGRKVHEKTLKHHLQRWASSYPRSSTQPSLGEATSSFAYFPDWRFISKHFREVDLRTEDPQPGDLFLFELQTPKAQYFGAHVGVYCGHGEIIHFMAKHLMETFVEDCEGVVYKEGLRQLRSKRKLLRVLRKRGGVNAKLLECRVQEAMEHDPPRYNIKNSNCVHFALKLLGMDSK